MFKLVGLTNIDFSKCTNRISEASFKVDFNCKLQSHRDLLKLLKLWNMFIKRIRLCGSPTILFNNFCGITMKAEFADCDSQLISIDSTWKISGTKVSKDTQTDLMITNHEFEESEMVTGISTEIVQDIVKEKNANMPLLKHYCKVHKILDIQRKDVSEETWRSRIENRQVTVDFEISTNTEQLVDEDYFLEYIGRKQDVTTQTENAVAETVRPLYSTLDDHDETKRDSHGDSKLSAFLLRILPILEDELNSNIVSKAFDGYETVVNTITEEISIWKTLSVDMEKHKVVFPDWSKGSYSSGKIISCTANRNGERLYDIEYKDNIKLCAVREEFIRVIDEGEDARQRRQAKRRQDSSSSRKPEKKLIRVQEGVRVHVRMEKKGTATPMFYPCRIVKVNKNGSVDVEVSGGNVLNNVLQDDLMQ
eukprot:gene10308-21508_t